MGKDIQEASGKFDSSNPWFIISVIVTTVIIILLVWNLLHSYFTIKSFNDKKLKLERASIEILYHIKSMEKTIRLAAASGDLRIKSEYKEHNKKFHSVLSKINKLIRNKKALNKSNQIRKNQKKTEKIEEKAFSLISYGEKKKAANLLKGWDYTKNQLRLEKSTKEFSNILHNHVYEIVENEKQVTFVSLIIVFVAIVILIISWHFSFKRWRINSKKRKQKEEEIIYLNHHDSLTDTYNRRYFMKEGKEEIIRAKRYDQYFSLMMLDIDHFKKINDRYGHGVGDNVLKKLSASIKNQIREVDILARLGGEEFAILLPGTGIKGAEKAAERIRNSIKNINMKHKGEDVNVTVSIGVTNYSEHVKDIDSLLQLADKALYEAKEDGRNKVKKNANKV